MEQGKGLILGIDIENKTTQAGYYDLKLGDVQSINLSSGSMIYNNPESLDRILSGSVDDQPDVDALISLLRNVLGESMRITNTTEVESLCITLPYFDIRTLNAFKVALSKLGVKSGRWQIISKTESFAYYSFNQRKELYSSGVSLLNYTEDGIHCERLFVKRKDNINYLIQENFEYESDTIKAAAKKEVSLEAVEDELCDFAEQYFEKRLVSAAYLTGCGFDVEGLPSRFAKLMVTRRKAFVGQNIFAKGACFAALEIFKPNVFKDMVLLLEDRIKIGIELGISEYGQPKRFRIIKSGTNWYMAERTVEFILEDVRELPLIITTPDNKYYEEIMDISEIPFREGKMTRISFNIKFTAADRCFVRVKDLGFGDFVKNSGKVVYKDIDFSEL